MILESGHRIIVPTATLEHHLRNHFAREGLVFRPNVISTLSHLVDEIVPDIPQISEAGLHLLVEESVARCGRSEFARVADKPGFHASLARTLQDLDTAGCNADRFARHLPAAPFSEALLAVWRDVESEMRRRGLNTRGRRLQLAAERVTKAGLPGVSNVQFEGFAQLSDPELLLVNAISANVAQALVPAVSALMPTLLFRETLPHQARVGKSADTAGTSACARLLVADNIEREADEIARRILLESERGVPFREAGIVIRNRKAYEPVLRATLERFGIPARFYFDSPLLDHPVTRFITGLVDSKLSGWEHEQTLAALKLAPSTGISSAMDRLDIAVREQLPNRGIGKLLALAQSDEILTKLLEASSAGVRDCPIPRDLFRPGKIKDEVPWSTVAIYRSQAAAVKAFEQTIEECSAWCAASDRPVPFTEYWRTLKTILRLTPLRVADQRRNVVHVLSAYEARQWDLPVLFVCGLIESEFPRRHPQNTFLPDIAIEDLQKAGIRLRTSADRNAEETFLFDSGIARASASLYLSYPRVDGRGEPYVPSAFINGVQNRVQSVEQQCRRVRPAPLSAPEKWKPASALVQPELLRIFNEGHTKFSATALESYLQCPFQFFATKTLRLREFPRRPEDRLDFLIRGNIVHKTLAEWFVKQPPLGPLFDRIFGEACIENHVSMGYRTEMWRHRLLQDLQRFCAMDTWPRGAVVETEKQFQFDLDENIAIKGRIDRLEYLPDGSAVVIDYKYSKAVNARKLIEDATKLQAPIYLLAIERALGLKPAAMVYYSLRDDLKIYGRGTVPGLRTVLEPLTRAWLDEAELRIVESVRQLRAGRIVPAPASMEPCRYCDVRDVCRFEGAAVRTAGGE